MSSCRCIAQEKASNHQRTSKYTAALDIADLIKCTNANALNYNDFMTDIVAVKTRQRKMGKATNLLLSG